MKQLLWTAAFVFIMTFASVASAEQLIEGSSIEVGFSQDDEPEPHMLVVFEKGEAKLYQLEPRSRVEDRKAVRQPSSVPSVDDAKEMSEEVYTKRLTQIVETEKFFTARQPVAKRCKDKYILRVKHGDKFRERRGCSLQADDPYATFAQVMFRDSFAVWNKSK